MRISMRMILLFVMAAVILALATPAMAQIRIIKGKVTDDKGQPVVGAPVLIQAVDSSARKWEAKTDKRGNYIYMGLPAGEYRVVVRVQGFSPEYVPSVRPTIQEESVIDFKLTPGPDQKLPFEYTPEELEQLKKDAEKIERRRKASAEVQALFDAGLQLAQQQKYAEAIEEFRKALEKDPEQPNIIANMADSYSKLDKNEEALELYKKAIAISPNESTLHTNMGVILSKMGKNAESQEAFKKAASLNPGASSQNYYNIGATLVNSGKTDEAIEAFRQAIAADANFSEAYYQLGMCLSGKVETMPEAISVLQKYIEIGKKSDQIEVAKEIIKVLQQSIKK